MTKRNHSTRLSCVSSNDELLALYEEFQAAYGDLQRLRQESRERRQRVKAMPDFPVNGSPREQEDFQDRHGAMAAYRLRENAEKRIRNIVRRIMPLPVSSTLDLQAKLEIVRLAIEDADLRCMQVRTETDWFDRAMSDLRTLARRQSLPSQQHAAA